RAFANARHVVARTSIATGENIIAITRAQPAQERQQISSHMLERLPNAAGLAESFDLSSANAILGRKTRTLAGSDSIEEVVGGIRFRISASSFFQVNIEILERIFEAIRPLAAQSQSVFDLYCGSGAFALCFAKSGCEVFGIEENAGAVDEARCNATLNELSERVQFRRGRVDEVLQEPAIRKRLPTIDAVFLDPPRKGSDPRTLTAIAEAKVRSIWYLSCDPATLARDLKLLLPKGYRLTNVQPFDMFPQTGHVESLALLSRTEK
ncbi:MAG: 23S rRNA (uracil(1939)-C(5))-methyltransferase RlmD, partial [Candidatus Eremiobacteraeota bacterium]|nr:23S rRNA (uracil(1939)-C(5))-methyltransferase RlmD [Candidatus Eremiobacteraeota bacterium]